MTRLITILAALPALLAVSWVALAVVDATEFYLDSLTQTHTAVAAVFVAVFAAVWTIAATPSLATAGCLAAVAVLAARDTVRIQQTLRNERAAAAPRPPAPAARTG